ncbi:family 2 glycosyl transferase [Pontibacillus chungwhensis BH030062]|uniref:Family 2 glycosyl transferase n=1 Tax=Pontibacillus chungwhensis BH030062 TaxID=1385513 RepID=A0A0A2US15_9BACI|nr:glycosyltransferase family 2 protein [Pontibacillus chungwhensis]KGP91097.1 family 2 glycosyl transferase [Pontibacillus chungwhensis BH030062]
MKKVYCVGMVKNEADIIESYIRYHLNIFDGIVLQDNGSTDRTIEIIKLLQSENLPIYLLQDENLSYAQGEKTTKLIHYTFNKFEPEFIFPLDVDEFLISPNHSANPKEFINKLSSSKICYLERELTYFPIHLDEKESFVPARVTYASPIKDYWPKVIVSKEIWEKYSPSITGGNHDLMFDKTGVQVEVLQDLKLLHYPYRSLEQIKSKITVGWINTLATHYYNEGHNYHWQELFEELRKNNLHFDMNKILQNDERSVPMKYAFCSPIEMKYTNHDEISAVNNLLLYCEALATKYRELDQRLREGY